VAAAFFSPGERDAVRERILELAAADPAITGAAVTGSLAFGRGDRWSDIDLALGVAGELGAALRSWTERLYRDFAAVHHWDLPSGQAIYRVFLLRGWLEADIAFIPHEQFGPLGPHWRTVFGTAARLPELAPPEVRTLAGRAWHHALHARVCIERERRWQAEHWISALRDLVLGLACLRLGRPVSYAKGAHLLPGDLTGPLEGALVRSLDAAELWRALGVAIGALSAELDRSDPALAGVLGPMLADLTAGTG
jgi:hypothetical protein